MSPDPVHIYGFVAHPKGSYEHTLDDRHVLVLYCLSESYVIPKSSAVYFLQSEFLLHSIILYVGIIC